MNFVSEKARFFVPEKVLFDLYSSITSEHLLYTVYSGWRSGGPASRSQGAWSLGARCAHKQTIATPQENDRSSGCSGNPEEEVGGQGDPCKGDSLGAV